MIIRNAYLRAVAADPARKTDKGLWVSDLGRHPRGAMNRVLHGEMMAFDEATKEKMNLGNAYEAELVERLSYSFTGTHKQFPLFNGIWSGYADFVIGHGTDRPIIVECKSTDNKWWDTMKPVGDYKAEKFTQKASIVRASYVTQLLQYGFLYQEMFKIAPKLILYIRSWGKYIECEVALSEPAKATSQVAVCGWKDGEKFNSVVPVAPILLRQEIERWFNAQQLPPDDGLVDSWEYAEYASAKLMAGQPTAQPDPQLDLLFN
jgi:hypothetical protein